MQLNPIELQQTVVLLQKVNMRRGKASHWGFLGGTVSALVIASMFLGRITFGETAKEKAALLYARVSGVKPNTNSSVLRQMTSLVEQRKLSEAVDLALNSNDFYNVSLFQYFAPLSNRAEAADVVLNDMIAMGIANTFVDPSTGKDRPYTELVKGDFTVKFNNTALDGRNNDLLTTAFNNRTLLTPTSLTISFPQRPNFPDAAGVLTSRQFMSEHAIAGTNRRMVHYAFREFLCTDIKDWRDGDTMISDDYVTRDVSRAPGGGQSGAIQYQTECRSCHQVQDGLRNAFAYHDFSPQNGPIYDSSKVVAKINKNIEFAAGFVVQNDNWENRAFRNANNKRFGWRGALAGNGAKKFGEMIANSDRFKTCAVERVWKHVCNRGLDATEVATRDSLARSFEADNYSLRGLFKNVALSPSCLKVGE